MARDSGVFHGDRDRFVVRFEATDFVVFDHGEEWVISLDEGLALARRFDQNAVVFIKRGKAPRLEFPEGETP